MLTSIFPVSLTHVPVYIRMSPIFKHTARINSMAFPTIIRLSTYCFACGILFYPCFILQKKHSSIQYISQYDSSNSVIKPLTKICKECRIFYRLTINIIVKMTPVNVTGKLIIINKPKYLFLHCNLKTKRRGLHIDDRPTDLSAYDWIPRI